MDYYERHNLEAPEDEAPEPIEHIETNYPIGFLADETQANIDYTQRDLAAIEAQLCDGQSTLVVTSYRHLAYKEARERADKSHKHRIDKQVQRFASNYMALVKCGDKLINRLDPLNDDKRYGRGLPANLDQYIADSFIRKSKADQKEQTQVNTNTSSGRQYDRNTKLKTMPEGLTPDEQEEYLNPTYGKGRKRRRVAGQMEAEEEHMMIEDVDYDEIENLSDLESAVLDLIRFEGKSLRAVADYLDEKYSKVQAAFHALQYKARKSA